jgi:hypothetical protein
LGCEKAAGVDRASEQAYRNQTKQTFFPFWFRLVFAALLLWQFQGEPGHKRAD